MTNSAQPLTEVPRSGSTGYATRHPLWQFGFRPKSRSFVVASTGAGKSTLCVALLDDYVYRYASHHLYILDPKKRFVAVEPREDEDVYRIFPDGFRESNHGKRDGVSVFAELLDRAPRARDLEEHKAFVIQDAGAVHDVMEWLYAHSDVRRPSLLYIDESMDMVRGVRADPALRRLLQQGREIGVGVVIVNQRPAWIDQTFISEADTLYIGALNKSDDRERLQKELAAEHLRAHLDRSLPRYTWLYADQVSPERSRMFKVKMGAKAA